MEGNMLLKDKASRFILKCMRSENKQMALGRIYIY